MEEWKNIEDSNYRVSSEGRVMNKSERILKERISRHGYVNYTLYIGGKPVGMTAHRLVASAFLKDGKEGLEVNHLDGNKRNNCVDNLEWCTKGENARHAYLTGLRVPVAGNSKLNIWQRKRIRMAKTVTPDISYRSLGSIFGVSAATICNLLNNKIYQNG